MNAPLWMRRWLQAAAIYNVIWGAWVVSWPGHYFELVGMDAPRYPELWQCVGMIVGVYGLGYWAASRDPLRHWPIVLVGLLGKILGPIGFLQAIVKGSLPVSFGATLLTNDFVWWIPFAIILWRAFERSGRPDPDPSVRELDARAALRTVRTSHGRTLEQHSHDAPHLVVFLRHFGCTFCREALADLARERATIEGRGTRLVLVHMAPDRDAVSYLAAHGLDDAARVSDPSATLYRAFRLRRGTFRQLFGLRSWTRGLVAGLVRGHGVGRLVGDGFQLPGVFLIDGGEIVREFRHREASEVPDYEDLATCPIPLSR